MLHLTIDHRNDVLELGKAFIFSFFSLQRRELMRICQVTELTDRSITITRRVESGEKPCRDIYS